MTNEEILEKQVEALEKLLQLRSAIIEELEVKVNKLEAEKILNVPNHFPWVPGVNIPWTIPQQPLIGGAGGWQGGGGTSGTIIISNTCPDGTPHQYPSMRTGIGTSSCTKCGTSSNITMTTSGASTSIQGGTFTDQNGNSLPVHTAGYIQPIEQGQANQTSDNVYTLSNLAK